MEKSIEKIWNESFINEQSLVAPKINDLYNQKSKSIISRIKRTYEIDNKGLIPIAVLVLITSIIFSQYIIGVYGTSLIIGLYFFNRNLLNRFNTIDIKSDNLTYLKNYRKIIDSVSKATKNLFMYIIPLVVLSIFILGYFIKDTSFLARFISKDTTLIEILGIGVTVVFIIFAIAMTIFKISTKILYGTLISKLDDIIKEIEELKQ